MIMCNRIKALLCTKIKHGYIIAGTVLGAFVALTLFQQRISDRYANSLAETKNALGGAIIAFLLVTGYLLYKNDFRIRYRLASIVENFIVCVFICILGCLYLNAKIRFVNRENQTINGSALDQRDLTTVPVQRELTTESSGDTVPNSQ